MQARHRRIAHAHAAADLDVRGGERHGRHQVQRVYEVHFEPALVGRDLEVVDAVEQARRTGLRGIAQRIDAARRAANVLAAHDVTFCVKLAIFDAWVRSTV